jgi:hypothetical protein
VSESEFTIPGLAAAETVTLELNDRNDDVRDRTLLVNTGFETVILSA